MKPGLTNDCFAIPDGMVQESEALSRLRASLDPVAGVEPVALALAHGRFLSDALVSPRPVPGHSNAAVDGYAFAGDRFPEGGGSLPVQGKVFAGRPFEGLVRAGHAVRIFTGAVMPDGTDTVVMQEDAQPSEGGEAVFIPGPVKAGMNRRSAGEDVEAGEVILEPGERLTPAKLAAAAASGFATLSVYKPLRVGLLSTGDELLPPGDAFTPGGVYDSNKPLLKALLSTYPVDVIDLGRAADTRTAVDQHLAQAAEEYDVLITTGGASTGEGDHIMASLKAQGSVHFWRIAVKPGRPLGLGQIGDCAFVGLPGNPVAVFVCFLLYVRPMLYRLGGGLWPVPQAFPLPAAFEMAKKKTGRREYLRGVLKATDQGLMVDKYPRDGSGLISGLRQSDGLIRLEEEISHVERQSPVSFIPYSSLGILD